MIPNINKYSYYFIFFLFAVSVKAQNKKSKPYQKFLDSAYNRVDKYPIIANTFLDSIPEPLSKSLDGSLSNYYYLKSLIASHVDNQSEIYHYNIQALKYAEKEKDYNIAGKASLELFYNLYIINNDSTAYHYLKKSEKFYTLDNNKNGLTEVMQMQAFAAFYNDNYAKSNALILPKLAHYQSIKEDQYYYMYALFMLTSNYLHLNDVNNYKTYFKKFKNLEKDTTISPMLYKKHEVTLYNCIAEMYFKNKALDSMLIYIKKASTLREYMNNSDVENYFENYVSYFDASKNLESKISYVDSLKTLQKKLIGQTADASFNINKTLLETTENLADESKKKSLNRNWIVVLLSILIAFFVFVLLRYKHIKNTLKALNKRKADYSFLQKNHEKLKVKVIGLEAFISEIKKEVKGISTVNSSTEQQLKIKDLYKSIHNNASTLLTKSENHLELINELNVDFFNSLATKHPDLNPSENIVCYYLFMGFKSKEIAAFLNTSERAIEGKRYRISNKLNLHVKNINLVEYLTVNFKNN